MSGAFATILAPRRATLAALCLLFAAACSPKVRHEPEDYYLIQSHDARAGRWTIVHFGTWDGVRQRRRYVLECSSYEDEQGQKTTGLDACSLPVGARLPPDTAKFGPVLHPRDTFWWTTDRRQPLFVVDMTNLGLLTVTEDDKNIDGKQISVNYFRVVKADVEADQ